MTVYKNIQGKLYARDTNVYTFTFKGFNLPVKNVYNNEVSIKKSL